MMEVGEDSIQDILELIHSALWRHHFHKNAGRVQEEVDVLGDHDGSKHGFAETR